MVNITIKFQCLQLYKEQNTIVPFNSKYNLSFDIFSLLSSTTEDDIEASE